MNEAKGIAWTYIDYKGYKISITVRGDGQKEAEAALYGLQNIINEIIEPDGSAWADRNNIYTKEDLFEGVDEVEFGETDELHTPVMMDDGSRYLGMKGAKLEDINENDSYDVPAQTYSYDGTWVNFYNGGDSMAVAGHYYATKVGAGIFDKMFGWSPAQVDHALIPGGEVLLTILGVKGKKTDDIYQNIKKVELA
jgi:hypothetical protein